MDTISRENNSMLPVGGIVVGVLGLLIAAYAAVSLQSVKNSVKEQQTKLEAVETAATTAASSATAASGTANQAAKDIRTLNTETQNAVTQIGNMLTEHAARITKMEEAAKKPAVVSGSKKGGEPVTAGPGEYIVKAGDGGAKIARDHGVTLADLQAVNPGVNWTKMKIGDKLKLPSTAKK